MKQINSIATKVVQELQSRKEKKMTSMMDVPPSHRLYAHILHTLRNLETSVYVPSRNVQPLVSFSSEEGLRWIYHSLQYLADCISTKYEDFTKVRDNWPRIPDVDKSKVDYGAMKAYRDAIIESWGLCWKK